MRRTVFPDPDALGRTVADRIADEIERAHRAGTRYLLGCPGGRSPMPIYRALAEVVRSRGLDLSGLVIAMMDEYVLDIDGAYTAVDPALPHSCRGFGRREIVDQLNRAAVDAEAATIPGHQLWLPDPTDPTAYDERLAAAGGLGLLILASGSSDGHVGFNPPGTDADTGTRVVRLAETTRQDNLATFPTFDGVASVPSYGVTIGIRTIREHARHAVMVVHGTEKARAAARITAADGYDPNWPATVVAAHDNAELYVDQAAAAGEL